MSSSQNPRHKRAMGFAASLLAIAKLITVEPAIFMQSFNWGLQSVISQNLMIAKVRKLLS